MTYLLVGEPAVEPVSLADAKAHLRITHDAEDALIAELVTAARSHVEREAGLAMIEQIWRLYLDDWPADRCVRLRRYPVRRIESATVFDDDGEAHSLDLGQLRLDTVSRPARLFVSDAVPGGSTPNGIEIEFVAGLAEAPPEVPDGLVRAIEVLLAQWYEFRGAYTAKDQPVAVPVGFERLIAPYRAHRV